jgi:hypothetical protein
VSAEQVREAVRQMLRESPECPTELKAANEILDLVRSYRALETGVPATKSEGLRWGLVRLDSALRPHLRRADPVRRGALVASDDRTLRDGLDEVRAALRDSSSEMSSDSNGKAKASRGTCAATVAEWRVSTATRSASSSLLARPAGNAVRPSVNGETMTGLPSGEKTMRPLRPRLGTRTNSCPCSRSSQAASYAAAE